MSFPSPVTVATVEKARTAALAGVAQTAGRPVTTQDVRRMVEFALGSTHVKEMPRIDKMTARIVLNAVEEQLVLIFGVDHKQARDKMPPRLRTRYDATVEYVHGPQNADESSDDKPAKSTKGAPAPSGKSVDEQIDDHIAALGEPEEGPELSASTQETLAMIREIKPRPKRRKGPRATASRS